MPCELRIRSGTKNAIIAITCLQTFGRPFNLLHNLYCTISSRFISVFSNLLKTGDENLELLSFSNFVLLVFSLRNYAGKRWPSTFLLFAVLWMKLQSLKLREVKEKNPEFERKRPKFSRSKSKKKSLQRQKKRVTKKKQHYLRIWGKLKRYKKNPFLKWKVILRIAKKRGEKKLYVNFNTAE